MKKDKKSYYGLKTHNEYETKKNINIISFNS